MSNQRKTIVRGGQMANFDVKFRDNDALRLWIFAIDFKAECSQDSETEKKTKIGVKM